MAKIVELKDVTKVYKTGEREFRALDGVDLSIEKGKFVVILGPSGAGKSTLLNLIGGMDIPTTGQVIVDGEDISKYNEDKLSRYRAATVGFIFQFYNILPTLTVLENVELVKHSRRSDSRSMRISSRTSYREASSSVSQSRERLRRIRRCFCAMSRRVLLILQQELRY